MRDDTVSKDAGKLFSSSPFHRQNNFRQLTKEDLQPLKYSWDNLAHWRIFIFDNSLERSTSCNFSGSRILRSEVIIEWNMRFERHEISWRTFIHGFWADGAEIVGETTNRPRLSQVERCGGVKACKYSVLANRAHRIREWDNGDHTVRWQVSLYCEVNVYYGLHGELFREKLVFN